jgi:hypothetical protein
VTACGDVLVIYMLIWIWYGLGAGVKVCRKIERRMMIHDKQKSEAG